MTMLIIKIGLVQKRTHKVTKQVYRVKKDGRLSKNSDLTQRIEKPTIEEISASSIEQISQMLNMFQII